MIETLQVPMVFIRRVATMRAAQVDYPCEQRTRELEALVDQDLDTIGYALAMLAQGRFEEDVDLEVDRRR